MFRNYLCFAAIFAFVWIFKFSGKSFYWAVDDKPIVSKFLFIFIYNCLYWNLKNTELVTLHWRDIQCIITSTEDHKAQCKQVNTF